MIYIFLDQRLKKSPAALFNQSVPPFKILAMYSAPLIIVWRTTYLTISAELYLLHKKIQPFILSQLNWGRPPLRNSLVAPLLGPHIFSSAHNWSSHPQFAQQVRTYLVRTHRSAPTQTAHTWPKPRSFMRPLLGLTKKRNN